MNDNARELLTRATREQEHAYAPYSGFCVGAALLGASGRIYSGSNIENAAYGPTLCAERVAFAKAVSEGERGFSAIAVVGGDEDTPCFPCGVCRQVMAEFCQGDFRIYTKNGSAIICRTLDELLPDAFRWNERSTGKDKVHH